MKSALQQLAGIRTRLPTGTPKSLLLTFDDGPDPEVTPRVLELLEPHGVKAVFFVVGGRIDKAPELLPEILERGHIIGNHTFSHWLGKPPGPKAYIADLKQCQDRIYQITGYEPRLFRPALGHITIATLLAVRQLNLQLIKWSLDTGDWQFRDDATARQQTSDVISSVKPRDILLMHDDNRHSPALLGEILPQLQGAGYDMASYVSQQLATVTKKSASSLATDQRV